MEKILKKWGENYPISEVDFGNQETSLLVCEKSYFALSFDIIFRLHQFPLVFELLITGGTKSINICTYY